MDALYQFGIDLIRILQRLSPALDGIMVSASFMGTPEFFLVILPFIYWSIDYRVGVRAMFVLFLFDFINTSLKMLFHQPRPFWLGGVDSISASSTEGSYGIPSGHSGRALAVSGYLGTHVRRNWFWAIVVIYILLVGLSRMYLGLHFPHDVLVGWVLGLLVIGVVIRWDKNVRDWLKDKPLVNHAVLGFLISIGIIFFGFFVRLVVSGTPDPVAWSAFNAEARTLTHFFTLAGAVFGAYTGYAMMLHYARFNPKGAWVKRVIRYLVGIVVLLGLFFGLDIAFAALAVDESTLGYVLRFIRYGIATFWATFLAPWLFLKIKLVDPE